jgi:hypothetical protein
MTTPFPFVSGAVLTAAQLNAISEAPVSAKTANYVLVAADAGSRITMSSASATTITVNTALFTAGQSLRIQNLNGGGTCTITAGTATVTSAGSLVIPSWGGGQLYFTSASAAVWFPDAANSGLTLIKAETAFTGQTSFNVANVFSATYNNYLIWIRNTAASSNGGLRFQLSGSGTPTAAGYSYQRFVAYGSLTAAARTGNTTSAYLQEGGGAYYSQCLVNISNPFSGQMTYTSTNSLSDAGYFTPDFEAYSGNQQTAVASQDGFTLLSITGTITGTYTVYGYAKS